MKRHYPTIYAHGRNFLVGYYAQNIVVLTLIELLKRIQLIGCLLYLTEIYIFELATGEDYRTLSIQQL
jgi:hypothetical protein